MKITMIALGSTGDVRPYILLGRELKSRGHQITIACFDSFRETLEKEGLGYAPITGNVVEMMANIMKPGTSGVKYLSQVEKTIREHFPDVGIAPYLIMGGTDCRHFHALTDTALRFAPIRCTNVQNAACHAVDENVTLTALAEGVRFYKMFLKEYTL